MKNLCFYCFFTVFLSLIGCKKDKETEILSPKIAGYIICDDTTGATFINYNFLLVTTANWVPEYFNVDANNDMIPDFRFESELFGSPGAGYHPRSHIQSLNSDTKFSGYLKNDTTYYSYTSNYYPQVPPVVVHEEVESISCYNYTGADSILAIKNNFKATVFNSGDSVTSGFFYKADSLILINDDISYSMTSGTVNDTISIHTNNNFYECNQFPMGSVKFIGFKTKISGMDKYGWIKLSITNQNRIFIYGMAVQK